MVSMSPLRTSELFIVIIAPGRHANIEFFLVCTNGSPRSCPNRNRTLCSPTSNQFEVLNSKLRPVTITSRFGGRIFIFRSRTAKQHSMKHTEAKRLIATEWDRWVQAQSINPREASARDSFKFFIELQEAGSPLLDFQTRGRDKWQIVHAWLLSDRRVR